VSLADVVEALAAFEVVIEDAHAADALLGTHLVKDRVDDLPKIVAVLARAARALVGERALLGLDALFEKLRRLGVAALLEIRDGELHLDRVVAVVLAF
jgi:hypothetical protein